MFYDHLVPGLAEQAHVCIGRIVLGGEGLGCVEVEWVEFHWIFGVALKWMRTVRLDLVFLFCVIWDEIGRARRGEMDYRQWIEW